MIATLALYFHSFECDYSIVHSTSRLEHLTELALANLFLGVEVAQIAVNVLATHGRTIVQHHVYIATTAAATVSRRFYI